MTKTISKKSESFKQIVIYKWGILFRAIFILSLGLTCYYLIGGPPQNIGDIPFSQLTLNLVMNNIFSAISVLSCLYWFFKFPNKKVQPLEASNYYLWAIFGTFSVLIILIITSIIVTIS